MNPAIAFVQSQSTVAMRLLLGAATLALLLAAQSPRAESTHVYTAEDANAQEFTDLLDRLPPLQKRTIEKKSRSQEVKAEAREAHLGIRFEFNSYALTPDAVRIVEELAVALKSDRLADQTFLVEGHTDAIGDEINNDKLSRLRANAVKDYLVRNHEIEPARLRTVGRGERDLLDPANPKSGVNRRVRIADDTGQ